MNDAAKWGLFDLLKALDTIHGGQHHEVFTRIAEGLNLALPALPPPPPDPAPCFGADKEAAGQDTHGRWIDECLDLSNANATLLLADLFASWTGWTEREKAFTGTTNALSRELVRRWARRARVTARRGSSSRG